MSIHLVLLILAALLFLLAAFHVEHPRLSFVPLGLFCWVAAILLGGK